MHLPLPSFPSAVAAITSTVVSSSRVLSPADVLDVHLHAAPLESGPRDTRKAFRVITSAERPAIIPAMPIILCCFLLRHDTIPAGTLRSTGRCCQGYMFGCRQTLGTVWLEALESSQGASIANRLWGLDPPHSACCIRASICCFSSPTRLTLLLNFCSIPSGSLTSSITTRHSSTSSSHRAMSSHFSEILHKHDPTGDLGSTGWLCLIAALASRNQPQQVGLAAEEFLKEVEEAGRSKACEKLREAVFKVVYGSGSKRSRVWVRG
ncbi:hypothetical protein BDK51DRAFT_31595, partial [Blyttiomyces helicus]